MNQEKIYISYAEALIGTDEINSFEELFKKEGIDFQAKNFENDIYMSSNEILMLAFISINEALVNRLLISGVESALWQAFKDLLRNLFNTHQQKECTIISVRKTSKSRLNVGLRTILGNAFNVSFSFKNVTTKTLETATISALKLAANLSQNKFKIEYPVWFAPL